MRSAIKEVLPHVYINAYLCNKRSVNVTSSKYVDVVSKFTGGFTSRFLGNGKVYTTLLWEHPSEWWKPAKPGNWSLQISLPRAKSSSRTIHSFVSTIALNEHLSWYFLVSLPNLAPLDHVTAWKKVIKCTRTWHVAKLCSWLWCYA